MRPVANPATILAVVVLTLGACSPAGETPPGGEPDPFALPPAQITERALRDSARVAQLVMAFAHFAHEGQRDKAFACYYPDSLPVAAPEGLVIWEGQSARAWAEIEEESKATRPARIEYLRRVETELLDNTQREIWHLQLVRADADSTRDTRRIHTVNGLGDDKRFLGRMRPQAEPREGS